MLREWLISYFDTSPAIRLLRADLAPYVLDFLSAQFKSGGAIARSHTELLSALRDYQEELHETDAGILVGTAEHYVSAWSSGETRWLRRFLEAERDEPMYELSSYVEDVLTFLELVRHRDRSFVGTESRLKHIMNTLRDLVLGASGDVAVRRKHLMDERDRIDAELRRIDAEGSVPVYHPTAIRERFADALETLVQLQGDFRGVEEAFKEITRNVQRQQIRADRTRGQILGGALDAEEGLKGEDQGISFDEFAKLILSPGRQEELEQTIRQLMTIEPLAQQGEGMKRIREMIPSLTAEARKVLRTSQRLTATLRRLLDRDSMTERQQLAEVLAEIRVLATHVVDDPMRDTVCGVTVESEPEIQLPIDRPFWSPETPFEAVELSVYEADEAERREAFANLASLRSLDWKGLRRRIQQATVDCDQISLGEMLARQGEHEGTAAPDPIEVLALVQIAHEDGHDVASDDSEWIELRRRADGRPMWLHVPVVRFRCPPWAGGTGGTASR
jgi:hypothetical protein